MRATYGVIWREGEAALSRGKLELLPRSLKLEGRTGTVPVAREIRYDELSALHVGRSSADRLNGHPTLVVELTSGARVVLASVAQSGVVVELIERLASFTPAPRP